MTIAILSVFVAAAAFLVSEAALFRPLRAWVAHHSDWLGKLVRCGFCLSWWFSGAVCLIWRPELPGFVWPFSAIVIAWLAAFQWALLRWIVSAAEEEE